jgi:hypothetical protein
MTQRNWRCEDGDHKRCAAFSCRCFCHLFDRDMFRVGTGIKKLMFVAFKIPYRYVRDSLPLWRDSAHAKAMAKLRAEHESRLRDLRTEHRRELEAERSQLENLLPKIIKVTNGYQRDQFQGRFTITTALSEDFIYQVLSGYSRDNRAMDYIGERMAYDIVRQIRTLDFSRTRAMAEFDNGHRQRISWMEPDGINFPPR